MMMGQNTSVSKDETDAVITLPELANHLRDSLVKLVGCIQSIKNIEPTYMQRVVVTSSAKGSEATEQSRRLFAAVNRDSQVQRGQLWNYWETSVSS